MTRRVLRLICRALIGVVLFAQLAVSAYACPALLSAASSGPDPVGAAIAAAVQPSIHCEDMAGPTDPEFANLCASHCHRDQQSDHAARLTIPAVLLTALYVSAPAPELLIAPRSAGDPTSALAAGSPPLAILHCRFRI
ncbi:hypothetical protein BH11PSE8_BH11PSE8_12600 [soil metagenome]